jgi:hypothetical protein
MVIDHHDPGTPVIVRGAVLLSAVIDVRPATSEPHDATVPQQPAMNAEPIASLHNLQYP